jgi:hypothetical protein
MHYLDIEVLRVALRGRYLHMCGTIEGTSRAPCLRWVSGSSNLGAPESRSVAGLLVPFAVLPGITHAIAHGQPDDEVEHEQPDQAEDQRQHFFPCGATGNGQRATGNGQRATGNGQRATGNGQRATTC